MLRLKPCCMALALLFPLLSTASLADVGVAAAVNPQALRTPPGARARMVTLGDRLIFRERIETSGAGLVQILLVDGSTFTVGANSDLVIDEFVYDPEAGNGRLIASFGKGVARFVGGKLSKNEGGVTINTPVGTIGIRGGIANLNVAGDNARFSFIFGDELTFLGVNGERLRVYESGYTLAVGGREGTTTAPRIRRTTQADIRGVQGGLAGRAGANGGTPRAPAVHQRLGSGVARINSRQGTRMTRPRPPQGVIRSLNTQDRRRAIRDVTGPAIQRRLRHRLGLTPPTSP